MAPTLRIKPDAVGWRLIDDQIVALDTQQQHYVAVNATGARLWLRLVDGATTAELAQVLVDEFGLDVDAAQRDADAFVEALSQRNLLETA